MKWINTTVVKTRKCRDCGHDFPISLFQIKCKRTKSGISYQKRCPGCQLKKKKQYYKPVKHYGVIAYSKHLAACRKQSKKESDTISNHFVLKCLKLNSSQATPELIETKRKQLWLRRKLKHKISQV